MGRLTRTDRRYSPGLRMEAIKKKMQAMKVEKDNLCDRCDEVEQKAKEAHIRQEKAEEECNGTQRHLAASLLCSAVLNKFFKVLSFCCGISVSEPANLCILVIMNL